MATGFFEQNQFPHIICYDNLPSVRRNSKDRLYRDFTGSRPEACLTRNALHIDKETVASAWHYHLSSRWTTRWIKKTTLGSKGIYLLFA